MRRCCTKQVDTVRQARWFGAGMLDDVVTVLGLAEIDEPWAQVLAADDHETEASTRP